VSRGKVVHVLGDFAYDVYVGRTMQKYGLNSVWGNPFKVKEFGRDKALWLYELNIRGWLAQPAPDHDTRLKVLQSLRGKTLACWCAPKDRPLTTEDETVCHGQILLRLAEEVSGA
jgi:Domain of unknown function (DUF4326)